MDDSEVMSFSLDWLAESKVKARPLDVCTKGHLVVRGNTHWAPIGLTPGLTSLRCVIAAHCDQPTAHA